MGPITGDESQVRNFGQLIKVTNCNFTDRSLPARLVSDRKKCQESKFIIQLPHAILITVQTLLQGVMWPSAYGKWPRVELCNGNSSFSV